MTMGQIESRFKSELAAKIGKANPGVDAATVKQFCDEMFEVAEPYYQECKKLKLSNALSRLPVLQSKLPVFVAALEQKLKDFKVKASSTDKTELVMWMLSLVDSLPVWLNEMLIGCINMFVLKTNTAEGHVWPDAVYEQISHGTTYAV